MRTDLGFYVQMDLQIIDQLKVFLCHDDIFR